MSQSLKRPCFLLVDQLSGACTSCFHAIGQKTANRGGLDERTHRSVGLENTHGDVCDKLVKSPQREQTSKDKENQRIFIFRFLAF